ncbi:MAG: dTDP-glucose 4,6-dehydratase [Acidimicrobiia bacterium]
MSRRYLVTGGAGFIGSNLVRHLLRADPTGQVTNLDLLTYAGVQATVDEIDQIDRHRFIEGDIRDPAVVDEVVQGHDVVIHLAAETHVDRSIGSPVVFSDTNVAGTAVLLEASRRHLVERFIHVSTDEVYGSVDEGFADEDTQLLPSSPYSASKAGADLLALAYHHTYGFPVIVTRCTNNFGPYQFPEKLIPLFVTSLLEGRRVPLYGDGANMRDWLHVEDHCRALHLLVDKGEAGQVYNIGANAQVSNLDLTKLILGIFKLDESWIESVPDRPGHDFRYAVNSGRIRDLGWAPIHSLVDRLTETIEWYRTRRDWWEPLTNSPLNQSPSSPAQSETHIR